MSAAIGCHPDGVVVRNDGPCEVSTEDGDRVWLPKAWYPTRAEAKQAVLCGGRSDFEVADCYIDVRCRSVWMRCEDRYQDGQRIDTWGFDEGSVFYKCEPNAEFAHPYWELSGRGNR